MASLFFSMINAEIYRCLNVMDIPSNVNPMQMGLFPKTHFFKSLRSHLKTFDMSSQSEEPGTSSSSLSTSLLAVILFIVRHHLTAAVGDLMALLNFLCPNLVVASKYLFDKIPALSTMFYCHVCKNYMGKDPGDASCLQCGTMFNKKNSTKRGHFFLSASLKDLLKVVLKAHGAELLPKTVNNGKDIKDVMDGKMYQNLLKQGTLAADDLTL